MQKYFETKKPKTKLWIGYIGIHRFVYDERLIDVNHILGQGFIISNKNLANTLRTGTKTIRCQTDLPSLLYARRPSQMIFKRVG